jgi:hypothetical protein
MAMSYVYIPSIRDCFNYYSLKEFAAEFARIITVSDPKLENKVLRAIMVDFNPKTFLQMLKSYLTESSHAVYISAVSAPSAQLSAGSQQFTYEPKALPIPKAPVMMHETVPAQGKKAPYNRESAPSISGDIIIDIPPDRKSIKREKENNKSGAYRNGKKAKQKRSQSILGDVFGKKAFTPPYAPLDTREAAAMTASPAPQPNFSLYESYTPEMPVPLESDRITQNTPVERNGALLRLAGNAPLPSIIDVMIAEGEAFTVGRYDTAAGRQQSNFEFDRLAKSISRRHAVIERGSDGYMLIDLSSSAGTFLNGQKLPPNTPCLLQTGCRVSFGNCGADYIWEQ